MCALIETNLDEFGVGDEEREVVCAEASAFLRRLIKKEPPPQDIVFFDPPYVTDYEAVLDYIGKHAAQLLGTDGLMIVEHHKKKELKEEFGSLHRHRSLKQGDSCLSFYSNAGSADVPSPQRA